MYLSSHTADAHFIRHCCCVKPWQEARYHLPFTDYNSMCRPSIIGNQCPLSSHLFQVKTVFSLVYQPRNWRLFWSCRGWSDGSWITEAVVYLCHISCPPDNISFPLLRSTSNIIFYLFSYCINYPQEAPWSVIQTKFINIQTFKRFQICSSFRGHFELLVTFF